MMCLPEVGDAAVLTKRSEAIRGSSTLCIIRHGIQNVAGSLSRDFKNCGLAQVSCPRTLTTFGLRTGNITNCHCVVLFGAFD